MNLESSSESNEAGLEQAAAATFWGHIGAQLVSWTPERVVVTLEIKPYHLNLMGILHGGVHAGLIDSAMGLAVMAARPDENAVTTNLNIHYLASVKEGTVTITAEIIHSTRRMITTQASAYSESGEKIAYGTGTFRVTGG